MARYKTLGELLTELRARTRRSLNPAHNSQARDAQVEMLQVTQEWLWEDFTWPHLRVHRDISLQDGQRYYDMPEDLDIDRIEKIEIRDGNRWLEVKYGIEAHHYTTYDSDLDQRTWPVLRWVIAEGALGDKEQIEVWPIPDRNADAETLDATLRVWGVRKLAPLVADSDRADLDSRLIVGYAAAEMLAAAGAKDATLKLSQAKKLDAKLRGGMVPRRRTKILGTGEKHESLLRGPPTVYYRVVDPS